jgi:hypothetical protein
MVIRSMLNVAGCTVVAMVLEAATLSVRTL